MANVLLTGGRAPVALDLARSFHQAGHAVFMAESVPGHLSQPSRVLRENFLVPPPRQHCAEYLAALREIILGRGIDLLIPTCEETFYISMGRDQLPCAVLVESISKMSRLHNKWEFYLLAQEMGLRVPQTLLVRDFENSKTSDAGWQGTVLKPVFSRFGSRTLIEPSKHQTQNALGAGPPGSWVAQEYIAGVQICSYSIAQAGRLVAHTAYLSNMTAGVGAAIAFTHMQHKAVREWVEKLVAGLQFTGQIAFDFIERPDGRLFALECNPRSTSGIHLLASNPEFPAAFFDASDGCVSPFTGSSSMLLTAMLMYGLPASIRRRQLHIWLDTLFSSRDVVFSPMDPWPFLLQFRSILFFMRLAREHHISPLAASTLDIEWNGSMPGSRP